MINKSQTLILSIPLILIVAFYGCNGKEDLATPPPHEETDPNYPTTLYPLSGNIIQQLQNEFDTFNNNKICTNINKYGFTGDDYYYRSYQSIPISKDSAFILAVNILLKNSKFVNIKDSSTLISSGYRISQVDVEGTKWKITFGPQIYDGFEIPFTWISVKVFGNEPYSIYGHWYSDIYIPSKYRIEKEVAKQKIIGERITWYGDDGNQYEFIVTKESITEDITKAIYPVKKENSIELRVTWKIPIMFSPGNLGWHIYLDVMNGEIVSIIQEFRT